MTHAGSLTGKAGAAWARLTPRERRGVTAAATLVGLALLGGFAVAPPLRTLREAPQRIAAREAQWQQMQRLAAQAAELRGAARPGRAQQLAALEAATARLGTGGRLAVAGDRATLTLQNAGSQAVRQWLADARSGARSRPVEVLLELTPQGYQGRIVVALADAGEA